MTDEKEETKDKPIYETQVAKVWQDTNGIVHLVYKQGAENTLVDAIKHAEILAEIAQGQKIPVLVNMIHLKSADRESREYGVSPQMIAVISATAALVTSPMTQMIVNLWMVISKPPFPVKMFTNEAEALEWLKQYRSCEDYSD